MTHDTAFANINKVKANLDGIYDQPDPRAYFRELRKLDYAVPGRAKPIFQKLIHHLQKRGDEAVHILDLGCSYGVNAALLKYDLSMGELYDHWGQNTLTDAGSDDVVSYGRHFLSVLDQADDITVIGLDRAEKAVAFAETVGLLDEGLAVDLEAETLSDPAKENLTRVDLVTSTGCVGYVTEKSFEHLLPTVTRGRPAWFANFVLRMFPFDSIADSMQRCGYATEKLQGHTFVQRRFASADEQEHVLERLRERGVDPAGKEAAGDLVAEFYLSRPMQDVAEVSIERLLST